MSTTLLATTLLLALLPQGVPKRAVPPKDTIAVDPKQHRVDRVVVKFVEGSGVQLRNGALTSAAVDLAPVRAVIGARAVQPFFAGLERELTDLRARVTARLRPGDAAPADLSLYFEVTSAGLDDARALVRGLNDLAAVELAYPREQPLPPPGDIPPLTPSFVAQQSYRAAAPGGIDARAIQQITGGWGSGVTLVDIEWGWRFDHEDIAVLRPSAILGPPSSQSGFDDHGLAVIGELAGDPDEFGVSGFVPDIRLRTTSAFPSSGYSVARAIVTALSVLRDQDVMLLEVQTSTPLGLGPTEWIQADFDAIHNATTLGVITVEAAGNGGVDLDAPQMNNRFNLNLRDSGALMVGATNGAALTRASFSCHGSRIDANGWGLLVTSAGYGDLFNAGGDPRQYYTSAFNGTSSASPMVAATVVAILGAARAQLDPASAAAIDYLTLRGWLRTWGTALTPPAQGIGLRPDLDQLLRAAGALRGLRILDDVKLGRTFRLEITPPFAAAAQDAWALFAAPQPANLAVTVQNPDPRCGRWLLDPNSFESILAGPFAIAPVVLTVPVPNLAPLKGARVYFQALAVQASSGNACLTSSSMAHVEI